MNERHHHAVYVISVFAEIAGVHPQTLRNYERSGLLSPQRTSGGSRRFSDADLARPATHPGTHQRGRQPRGRQAHHGARGRVGELRARARRDCATTARDHVDETHRQYRRDLVPVRNTIAVFLDAQTSTTRR